jgi:lipopolysaccharide transport system permease protein
MRYTLKNFQWTQAGVFVVSNISISNPTQSSYPITQKKLSTHPFLQDAKEGLHNWRIWLLLSWQDIRLRYRRSQLGPFWLTISMALTIYMMGFLYSHLLHLSTQDYFPFLAAGLLVWHFIALMIGDGINIFVQAEHFIKQVRLPYSVYVLRVLMRTFIIFLHNIVVLIPLYFFFHIQLNYTFLLIIPGIILLLLNAYFYGFILALIGARYRDLAQLITSVIQIIFFVTPIMWNPVTLPEKYQIYIKLNPAAQLIEVLRAPLISTLPNFYSLTFVLGMTLFGAIFAAFLF